MSDKKISFTEARFLIEMATKTLDQFKESLSEQKRKQIFGDEEE